MNILSYVCNEKCNIMYNDCYIHEKKKKKQTQINVQNHAVHNNQILLTKRTYYNTCNASACTTTVKRLWFDAFRCVTYIFIIK